MATISTENELTREKSSRESDTATTNDEKKTNLVRGGSVRGDREHPTTMDKGDDPKSFLRYDERRWWERVPFVSTSHTAPHGSIDDAPLSPEATASWLSLMFWNWLTPMMSLGYARPLEATDLWRLADNRSAQAISSSILESFDRRHNAAEEYNQRLADGSISPGLKKFWWKMKGNADEREKEWRSKTGKKKASLTYAMNGAVSRWFWFGGLLKVVGDVLQMTSPLIVKEIIRYAQGSWAAYHSGLPAPSLGHGIGLAFGLGIQQCFASLCLHHSFYHCTSTGVLLRGGLITAIYQRSLRLTSRARAVLSNGRLVNHISTDVSRIDFACMFFHLSWSAFIQLILCLVLLLVNLGPSALAGFSFFLFASPMQTLVMRRLFNLRRGGMVWTDKRAKLLQELLGGMRVIKYFGWEVPFIERIGAYRKTEMKYIRSLLLIRAANNAIAFALPVLAAIVSFIVYATIGHTLDPAVIFTALTLFQLLRLPLQFMPMGLSAIADAQSAIERLYDVFVAELLTDTRQIDPDLDVAVLIQGATFQWDGVRPDGDAGKKGKSRKRAEIKSKMVEKKPAETAVAPLLPDQVYKLQNIDVAIPHGQLCAIVGPVGSGKSSLLQAMIGEMRRIEGKVTFSGSVGYCPQTAWIQNATIRENICFGRPFEEAKYWAAVQASSLEPDLEMLPHGDATEVGEKGITLSGGQRQRVNICRAIYCDNDIIIFDDPFSALDAHVGKAVFQNVMQGCLAGRTRIIVTHALHFLPFCDHILVMDNGRIAESGTYGGLMVTDGEFARFAREFGSKEDAEADEKGEEQEEAADEKKKKKASSGGQLMTAEERNTGSVSSKVYAEYFASAHGNILLPLLLLSGVFMQGANVMAGYWLVWWQEMKFKEPQGFYMGIYAALGVAQAIGFFLLGAILSFITYFGSQALHRGALKRVLHAPMSFFDTTPLGRIMNRFSKDIDTIDNTLSDALRMLVNTLAQIIGSVLLIAIVLPWFLIGMTIISVAYWCMAIFYRTSARELKRLDAILRSSLYSHFSESLAGLGTIRAYGETERFLKENIYRMDVENRAYWLTVTNQRWLGIRLDALGILLTFSVSILAVSARFSISPSLTGLVLSYILTVQQGFGWLVRQSAEVENDMNSVERILHYSHEIEQEAPRQLPDHKPPPEWPSSGQITLDNIVLKYRPGLPAVLKSLSLTIEGGEKVGIVGRTGAGKSSIMAALFRLVELSSGKIEIDGIDIKTLGLDDLRTRLAIIPQDSLLFSGTLRTNLDPFGRHDDATLNDALRRSYLIDSTRLDGPSTSASPGGSGAQAPVQRFSLDTLIDDEGSNLSQGQKSLVSLARALVVDAKILIMDEATASVDYETDHRIQHTIAKAFRDRTILCIAHRLKTILSYDRICVMEAGELAEMDTPENLFMNPNGIFRGMCERSSITLEDIRAARQARREILEEK